MAMPVSSSRTYAAACSQTNTPQMARKNTAAPMQTMRPRSGMTSGPRAEGEQAAATKASTTAAITA